jgi:ribokinase
VGPDLLILGQVTVDHVVPATPGPWREAVGGNALYAAAGARLWCDPARIGVVSRVGRGLPMDVSALLGAAGLPTAGLTAVESGAMVEWLLYEEDGSRRSYPRDPELREAGTDDATRHRRYLARLEALSPAAADIPTGWLPARAAHLAPQVASRHAASLAALRAPVAWIGVDPSPFYARSLDERGLAAALAGSRAFLPSRMEVEHLAPDGDWAALVRRLRDAGFPEVVLKLGGDGCLIGAPEMAAPCRIPPAPAVVADLTGAGDAFCGAYAAARLGGLGAVEAGRRAAVAAAMVVECTGAAAALALSAAEARRRLGTWINASQGGRRGKLDE